MVEKGDSIFLQDISEHIDMDKLLINQTKIFTHKITDLNNLISIRDRTKLDNGLNNIRNNILGMKRVIKIDNPNNKLSSSYGKLKTEYGIKENIEKKKNNNSKFKLRINSGPKKNFKKRITPNKFALTKKIFAARIIKKTPLNQDIETLNTINIENTPKTLGNINEKKAKSKKIDKKKLPKNLILTNMDKKKTVKINDSNSNKKDKALNNIENKILNNIKKNTDIKNKNTIGNSAKYLSSTTTNNRKRLIKFKPHKKYNSVINFSRTYSINNITNENNNKNENTDKKNKIRINSEIISNETKYNILKKTVEICKSVNSIQKTSRNEKKFIEVPNQKYNLSKSVKTMPKTNKNSISEINKNFYEIKSHFANSQSGRNRKGENKTNQDTYIYIEKVNDIKNFDIFGVLDGHGGEGHYISKYVSNYIITHLTKLKFLKKTKDVEVIYQKLKCNDYQIITDLFLDANASLKHEIFDYMNSGTTCILIFHIGIHIICANCGDSRAIFVYDENNITNLKNSKCFPLSVDCKPELKEEKQRIVQCGGEVKKIMGNQIGPYRVWMRGKDYPGLAMSRSIGDFCGKDVGIICDPMFMDCTLSIYSKYIVVCSDGVWEFLTNEEVMNIGRDFYVKNDVVGYGMELIKIATNKWKKEDCIMDDITAVIVFF